MWVCFVRGWSETIRRDCVLRWGVLTPTGTGRGCSMWGTGSAPPGSPRPVCAPPPWRWSRRTGFCFKGGGGGGGGCWCFGGVCFLLVGVGGGMAGTESKILPWQAGTESKILPVSTHRAGRHRIKVSKKPESRSLRLRAEAKHHCTKERDFTRLHAPPTWEATRVFSAEHWSSVYHTPPSLLLAEGW